MVGYVSDEADLAGADWNNNWWRRFGSYIHDIHGRDRRVFPKLSVIAFYSFFLLVAKLIGLSVNVYFLLLSSVLVSAVVCIGRLPASSSNGSIVKRVRRRGWSTLPF